MPKQSKGKKKSLVGWVDKKDISKIVGLIRQCLWGRKNQLNMPGTKPVKIRINITIEEL